MNYYEGLIKLVRTYKVQQRISAVRVLVIRRTVFEENGIFGKIGRARLSTLKDFMFIFSFSAAD